MFRVRHWFITIKCVGKYGGTCLTFSDWSLNSYTMLMESELLILGCKKKKCYLAFWLWVKPPALTYDFKRVDNLQRYLFHLLSSCAFMVIHTWSGFVIFQYSPAGNSHICEAQWFREIIFASEIICNLRKIKTY